MKLMLLSFTISLVKNKKTTQTKTKTNGNTNGNQKTKNWKNEELEIIDHSRNLSSSTT
eukprot:m.21988 g.21988  ORF g.21988 m.21988 type:complete len:58 (+) comp13634_c0_seq1:87-260(+)